MCSTDTFYKVAISRKVLNSSLFRRHKKLHESETPAHDWGIFPMLPTQVASSFPGNSNTGRKMEGTSKVKYSVSPSHFQCYLHYGSVSSQTDYCIFSFHQPILDLSFSNIAASFCSCSNFLLLLPVFSWGGSQSTGWLLSNPVTCAVNNPY